MVESIFFIKKAVTTKMAAQQETHQGVALKVCDLWFNLHFFGLNWTHSKGCVAENILAVQK